MDTHKHIHTASKKHWFMSCFKDRMAFAEKRKVKGYSPITEWGSMLCPWFSGLWTDFRQKTNATWDHVRDNKMTFSCARSKWQIDVNALTQNPFSLLPNSQAFWFHFSGAATTAAPTEQLSMWKFHTKQSLLIVDGVVFHYFSLLQSVNNSSSWSERNQWPLFSLPWSLTLSEWQSEEIYWHYR